MVSCRRRVAARQLYRLAPLGLSSAGLTGRHPIPLTGLALADMLAYPCKASPTSMPGPGISGQAVLPGTSEGVSENSSLGQPLSECSV